MLTTNILNLMKFARLIRINLKNESIANLQAFELFDQNYPQILKICLDYFSHKNLTSQNKKWNKFAKIFIIRRMF